MEKKFLDQVYESDEEDEDYVPDIGKKVLISLFRP